MHICATNICVWIRTLVIESLKEITLYHQGRGPNSEDGAILDSIRTHSLRHAGTVMGTNLGPDTEWEPINLNIRENINSHQEEPESSILSRMVHTTARITTEAITRANQISSSSTSTSTTTTSTTPAPVTTTSTTTTTGRPITPMFMSRIREFVTSSTLSPPADEPSTTSNYNAAITTPRSIADFFAATSTSTQSPISTSTPESIFDSLFGGMENALQYTGLVHNDTDTAERSFESLDSLFPSALVGPSSLPNNTSCGRVNIMGTIVKDSAPYLYPFIIEYSLIGAVVIYVMWKHIGRHPKYVCYFYRPEML